MNYKVRLLTVSVLVTVLFTGSVAARDIFGVSEHMWKPQKDEVYLQEVSTKIPTEKPVLSVAEANGIFYALMGENVYTVKDGTLTRDFSAPSGVTSLESEGGKVWALSGDGIYQLQYGEWKKVGSRLFISTDRGLAVLRGAALTTLKGVDGMPVENTTCLEKGFDGDVWIGTRRGAVRMLDDDWHYFGADLWLPDNNVNDIAVGDNIVLIKN